MLGSSQNKGLPVHGGDRVWYSYNGTTPNKSIIFVNGINNTIGEHALACQRIVNAVGCDVMGVYNQTGLEHASGVEHSNAVKAFMNYRDVGLDLGQCLFDQVGLIARGGIGYAAQTTNGCTASLLYYLLTNGRPGKQICIMAHSQGNLITANALMQYSAIMQYAKTFKFNVPNINTKKLQEIANRGPSNIHVFAVASPAWSWPTNHFITMKSYIHFNDPVANLAPLRNIKGSLNGDTVVTSNEWSHGIETYLDDELLVDDVCKFMGSKPRYVVYPKGKKYDPKWLYIDPNNKFANSQGAGGTWELDTSVRASGGGGGW